MEIFAAKLEFSKLQSPKGLSAEYFLKNIVHYIEKNNFGQLSAVHLLSN